MHKNKWRVRRRPFSETDFRDSKENEAFDFIVFEIFTVSTSSTIFSDFHSVENIVRVLAAPMNFEVPVPGFGSVPLAVPSQ